MRAGSVVAPWRGRRREGSTYWRRLHRSEWNHRRWGTQVRRRHLVGRSASVIRFLFFSPLQASRFRVQIPLSNTLLQLRDDVDGLVEYRQLWLRLISLEVDLTHSAEFLERFVYVFHSHPDFVPIRQFRFCFVFLLLLFLYSYLYLFRLWTRLRFFYFYGSKFGLRWSTYLIVDFVF